MVQSRLNVHRPEPKELPPQATRQAALEEFANRLHKAMMTKGLSQSDLARRAEQFMPDGKKVGKDSISQYMRAQSFPNPAKLQALAKALGMAPGDLMPVRGVRAVKTGKATAELRRVSEDRAWVHVDQEVKWTTALKIMTAISEDEQGGQSG